MEDFSQGPKRAQRKYTFEDKSLGVDFHTKNAWGMNPNIDDDEKPATNFEELMKEEEREELRKRQEVEDKRKKEAEA